ncbi:MAG: thioredoxin family protein [Acidimicrobiia bacterium]
MDSTTGTTAYTEEIVTMTTATINPTGATKTARTDQDVHIMCFSATESRCSQIVSQMVTDLEDEYAGHISTENVDVWADPQRAVEYGVLTLPTVIVTIDGDEQFRVSGSHSRRQLLKKLDRRTGLTL